MADPSFGDYEFTDNQQIRDYCQRVRKSAHVLGLEVALAAAELQAALSQVRPLDGAGLLGHTQKRRARQVAKHLKQASDALRATAAAATRTYAAFRQQYSQELDRVSRRGPRPKFEFKPE